MCRGYRSCIYQMIAKKIHVYCAQYHDYPISHRRRVSGSAGRVRHVFAAEAKGKKVRDRAIHYPLLPQSKLCHIVHKLHGNLVGSIFKYVSK
jgi:hypothetical protein